MTLKRDSPDVLAEQSRRLLNDPAFTRAMDGMEQDIIEIIANSKSDGTAQFEEHERELCRQLRTLRHLRRRIKLSPQNKTLRDAQKPPHNE